MPQHTPGQTVGGMVILAVVAKTPRCENWTYEARCPKCKRKQRMNGNTLANRARDAVSWCRYCPPEHRTHKRPRDAAKAARRTALTDINAAWAILNSRSLSP